MSLSRRPVAYLTAGAGGMYCGSCMHDNTLARALQRQGVDVQLIPTYTPIRTDEEDVSIDRVFFGGINVFLEQKLPLYRLLPSWLGRVFDLRSVLRWATARPSAVDARFLGAVTVSMLRGTAGNQRREVEKLCRWLQRSLQPRLVVFTNMLIAGCAERLKAELQVPILVTLQGDDLFLEALPEPYRSRALGELKRLVRHVDGFLLHSHAYAQSMQPYLGIPAAKCHRVPLGIDTAGYPPPAALAREEGPPKSGPPRRHTIGYLARLAPEKGLHLLVQAFLELHRRPHRQDLQLQLAGWLGPDQRGYAQAQFRAMREAGLGEAFHYAGSIDRHAKLDFLRGLDLFSVPTTYAEPKGLYVLEALAMGVPVVQPEHGAFGEMLRELGGGRLVPPNDPLALADGLDALLGDAEARRQLGRQGALAVHTRADAQAMARGTWQVWRQFVRD